MVLVGNIFVGWSGQGDCVGVGLINYESDERVVVPYPAEIPNHFRFISEEGECHLVSCQGGRCIMQ